MTPPSICAAALSGLTTVAAVDGRVDVADADPALGRHRHVRDLGDDGAEALGDGDAPALALGQGAAPVGHLRRPVEGGAEPRVPAHQVAPEPVGVPAGGVGHLVDERLLEEAVLRVQHRPPRALADVVRRTPAVEPLVGDGVGQEQRLAVAAPGVVGGHGEGTAVGVERARVTAHRGGPIVVVLDVVLAAPDQLDRRRGHRLRDAHPEVDVVEAEREPAAVASAEHQIGELDLIGVEVEGVGGDGSGVQRVLGARPHLGAVPLDARRARHRLHRGVGEERHAVVGGDDLGRLRRHLGGVAERLVERREDRRAGDAAVAGVVVGGAERGQRLAGRASSCRRRPRPRFPAPRPPARRASPSPAPGPPTPACRPRPARCRRPRGACRAT